MVSVDVVVFMVVIAMGGVLVIVFNAIFVEFVDVVSALVVEVASVVAKKDQTLCQNFLYISFVLYNDYYASRKHTYIILTPLNPTII